MLTPTEIEEAIQSRRAELDMEPFSDAMITQFVEFFTYVWNDPAAMALTDDDMIEVIASAPMISDLI